MRQRARHPESPLVRLLRDPGGELRQLLDLIRDVLAQALPYLGAIAGLALALTLALWLLYRQRATRLAENARLVRIAVPPELDPQAAGVLWKSLHDLLRPRLARLLQGQPHISWEIAADRAGGGCARGGRSAACSGGSTSSVPRQSRRGALQLIRQLRPRCGRRWRRRASRFFACSSGSRSSRQQARGRADGSTRSAAPSPPT